jgi:uncharacterized protein (DUF427 family)
MMRFRALLGDEVIADSGDVLLLEGNAYFPPGSVRWELLEPSRSKSLCPWKGVASYYTVAAGGLSDRDAAWTYRHPSPLARKIKDRVAFWHGVRVEHVPAERR